MGVEMKSVEARCVGARKIVGAATRAVATAGVATAAVATAISLAPFTALAQTFPAKPIRIVVPFPPGGVDVTLRSMQPLMQADLGQSIVLENRPGANGYIGSEIVAKSTPDGYTLLATSSGTMVSGPFITRETPFDALKDFTPITQFQRTVSALVVKTSLPVTNMAELITYAKKNPGKLSYGSSGVGSVQHLDAEIIKRAAGIDMVHVPYKGGGPQGQALVAGEIDVSFHPLQQMRAFITSGKARIVAIYGPGKRFAGLPNVPDVTETMPDVLTSPSWVGVFGPAGLQQPVLMRLNSALVKALTSPEVRPKYEENAVVVANTPQEFAVAMRADVEKAGRMVKELKAAGVQLE
ncbi:MAG: Bug family tripartite tricarboxylate transporter substrate binding protein [Burkholderiales bacterium]